MAYFLPSTLGTPFLKWRTTNNPSHKFPLFSFPSKTSVISSHFRRPTNRQNYLRKKLTRQQQQLQQVSHNQNLNKVDMHDLDFDISVERIEDPNDNKSGESIVWNKLENWVEQYKKDSEFWGLGTHPIFIIYHNSQGKVERVVVDEAEILRRSRINPQSDNEIGKMDEFNFKVSFAKDLAKEMENGGNVIPRNSSVTKFLLSSEESNSMEVTKDVAMKPGFLSRMSRGGVLVLCGVCVVWAIRRFLTAKEDNNNIRLTRLEKEMLRRKIKARAEKEQMVKDNVEVVQGQLEPRNLSFTRPQLDKEVLKNSIIEAAGSNSELMMEEVTVENKEFDEIFEEIRAMARNAREIERGITSPVDGEAGNYQALENLSSHDAIPENEPPIHNNVYDNGSDETMESMPLTDPEYDIGKSTDESSGKENEALHYCIPNVVLPDRADSSMPDMSNNKLVPKSTGLIEADLHNDGSGCKSGPNKKFSRKKLKVITSAKEAREYLSRKNCELEAKQNHKVRQDEQAGSAVTEAGANVAPGHTNQTLELTDEVCGNSPLSGMHAFSHFPEDQSAGMEAAEENVINLNKLEDSGISANEVSEEKEDSFITSQNSNFINEMSSSIAGMAATASTKVGLEDSIMRDVSMPLRKQNSEDTEKDETFVSLQVPGTASLNEEKDATAKLSQSVNEENWIEKNFHEFEPIVEKIGVGFRENYHVAREKASQELDSNGDMMQLKAGSAEDEFEWMKDERLREVVFKVRDNELSGRDPFHLMEEEDKSLFFHGLEQKVEKLNEKLLNLHEYFHSNIENLDYGADGISIYDPPEKIIPRWKSPPAEKNPKFLDNFFEQRKALAAKSLKNSSLSNSTGNEAVCNSEEPSLQNNVPMVGNVSERTELHKNILSSSKTVIHGSDGSIKKGQRSGKEFWQHTKKWSQGFLESYNAETDPERKAVMKDIGKDLDRWITEKEIQEAANLMDNLPEKGQKYIRQKLDKVKREMELFGPQAVVSKYREYAEEKEEDYLWWLDLPYVLCIELYTVDNEEERVGFYSLEMAADLELDPKQYHVIAFEDACACKNLCYIIQAHLEILGNGNAFVVARPPKDAFREAKENGFGVTVIRKGQLQLNIDQTLEEVEESITEIGSKIFHDKIMKERGVDINALMKGVFGINKPAKRNRSKRKLKRGRKP